MKPANQRGSAAIYAAMLAATLSVTVGVALTLYPAAERTDSWILSLVMLCFAAVTLFAFPIFHGRRVADHRVPAFVFGIGMQLAVAIYAAGVVALTLLSGVGTLRYSLVERAALADSVKLQSIRATGTADAGLAGDGKAALANERKLPAGAIDRFDVLLTVKGDAADVQRMVACASPAWSAASELGGSFGSIRLSPCAGGSVAIDHSGDLEIRKSMLAAPTARGDGSFEIPYRIEVSNRRWFVSFRSLAIAHVVWLLGLFVTAGFWRMGSSFVTTLHVESKTQRADFNEIKLRMTSFAARTESDTAPPLKPFVSALRRLQDDIAYSTPETPPGSEASTREILAAIEGLGAAYAQARQNPATEPPATAVDGLVEEVRRIAHLVRDRNLAVRAAR